MQPAIIIMILLLFLIGGVTTAFGQSLCQKCSCKEDDYLWPPGSGTGSYDGETRKGFLVDCSGLGLTDIPSFSDLPSGKIIKKLDLSKNGISHIPCDSFSALRGKVNGILLGRNQIHDIRNISDCAFSGIENDLEYLDFTNLFRESGNAILSHGIWKKLKNLKVLTLAGCKIPVLNARAFAHIPGLTALDLSWNYLPTIPDENAFQGLDNLVWLRLSHLLTQNNHQRPVQLPQELFTPLKSLEYLDLDGNYLSAIPANSFSTTKMQALDLDRLSLNDVDSVHPDAFAGIEDTLQKLSFYHSDLTVIPVKALEKLRNLRILSFNSNDIRIIPKGTFLSLVNLKELTLDHNPVNLTAEGFIGLENRLQMLSIRKVYDKIEDIQLEAIRTLKSLDWLELGYSGYKYILKDSFSGISAKRITLIGMEISRVEKGAFNGLKGPVAADLENNKIENVSWVMDPCLFKRLDLRGNPIHCDCDLYRVATALRGQDRLFGKCASPPQISNLSFDDESHVATLLNTLRLKCGQSQRRCPIITYTSVGSVTQLKHTLVVFAGVFATVFVFWIE